MRRANESTRLGVRPSNALLVRGARQIVTMRGPVRARRGAEMSQTGIVTGAAMLVENGRITQVGPASRIENLTQAKRAVEVDASGCVVVPGLVDCHTHLLFPAPRLQDYEKRIGGATYEEIAASGGGILSTVRAVRCSTAAGLEAAAARSLELMASHGTLLAEAKSGYGLETGLELRLLRALHRVSGPAEVVPTCLGAHAIPPEWKQDPDGYLAGVCAELLPEVARHKLAEFADIYCDSAAFSAEQSARYFDAATRLGFGLKIHASQFSSIGAVELAVTWGAVSADHLEAIEEADAELLARSGTIAVLLPASVLHLGLNRYAPARKLIDLGAAVALATDFNPGSSPTPSLPLVMSLACAQMRMSPAEAMTAVTVNAAAALRRAESAGMLESGRAADFCIFNVQDYREIPYYLGANLLRTAYRAGGPVFHQGGM
ncbi:MAG: imidazolonepropionase [Candidatus Solibacter sp.]|nr:imidazolonepropionase [Candidatus Solibacter sp.]